MRTSNTTDVSFKALLERCGDALACRLAVSAVRLDAEAFAGMALGYLGEGYTQLEQFYVRFEKERTREFIVGDLDALAKRPHLLDMGRADIRCAIISAGKLLAQYCIDTNEGFWRWRGPAQFPLRWLQSDPDCAIVEPAVTDERVWLRVSAHLGTPAGLEV